MHSPVLRAAPIVAALLVLCLPVSDVEATRIRQLGLADMTARAERIFVGRCLERATLPTADHEIPATRYRFEVIEAIKGVDTAVVEIRIPGAKGRDEYVGMPRFRPGERVLLLLYPEGPSGLTVPLGLGQGKFRLETDGDGDSAINAFGNRRLLRDVPPALAERHGLRGESGKALAGGKLTALIRELAAGEGRRP